MESYHTLDRFAIGNADSSCREIPVRAARKLGPFEYIATPPIQHLLDAILDYSAVGGSVAPGVRQLAEMSGVTLGLISGLLYELDRTGHISYDGHVIMVLRDYRRDQESADQLISDSLISDDESPFDALESDDQNPDRFDRHMVDLDLAAAHDHDSAAASTMGGSGGDRLTDQRRDQHPAALVLAELGTNATLRKRALQARPDLTPQQVRDTWAHFEARIAAGRCSAAAFHAAIAQGELHTAPPDPNRPIDTATYAADPAFALGGAPPPGEESIGDHASRILPPRASTADWVFVQERLVRGDTDDQALAALAKRGQR